MSRPELGPALVAARSADPPVPWKVLVERHGKSRARLAKLYAEALGRPGAGEIEVETVVSEARALLAEATCLLDMVDTDQKPQCRCGVLKKDVY